ncbi:beta-glucuronidase [Silvibacterium bohemicum]|uniref:Beta-glucuronidase n=1 Tax=Silvibacterium bohemicum TaxID=1577686 RepID=A0A841K6R2_9BACT|nr:glycoside hydrolase family 2 TIM barrel-domain containing protein [Silvibacterium bohemicum]MBB6145964.1 beta-glucuronidase [Silvibacterium bohemicum]
MRKAAVFLALLFSTLLAAAEPHSTSLADVDHRPSVSLDGPWHSIVDPYKGGWGSNTDEPGPRGYAANLHYTPGEALLEYDFAKSPVLQVPGDWNTQREDLFYYEGLLWYQRDFTYHPKPHTRAFLHIGAANYSSHVFVNDVLVCGHEGGFTPFDCEISSAVKDGANFVVIAVDDRREKERVPTLKTDWYNYGGLTRSVSIVEVPETFIDDAWLHLTPAGEIEGSVHVTGAAAGAKVAVHIPELSVDQSAVTDEAGLAKFAFHPSSLEAWSPEHPRLYKVEYTAGSDRLQDDVGFRTIEVKGDEILLNGKPVFLRGINIHAEAPVRGGRAWSEEDAKTLLSWAKELNCNFVRLAHYPHDEHMTRLADKMGLLVWSEIPVYWSIDWTNPHTLDVAKQQLHEMIQRDHDKASVILWSMSNETPVSADRTAFIRKLIAQAREEDSSRLITSALLTSFHGKTAVLDDPLGADLDVLGYNEYIGWYMDKPDATPEYKWEDPMHKPVVISEFGGGAKAGLHGPVTQRFTEEYQAEIYKKQFEMFKDMPFLQGIIPWVVMDFRSPTRQLPDIQDGYNRKGLVSNKGVKKQAFSVLQDYYAKKKQ